MSLTTKQEVSYEVLSDDFEVEELIGDILWGPFKELFQKFPTFRKQKAHWLPVSEFKKRCPCTKRETMELPAQPSKRQADKIEQHNASSTPL